MPRNAAATVGGPREGSPWTGFDAVYFKELADHLTGWRMAIMEWLVVVLAVASVYIAVLDIKQTTAEDPFLFLSLLTHASGSFPTFVYLLGLFVPLVSIGLGFDAISAEFNQRTMSRILAQPVYRDALLFGKFCAALTALSVALIALWLLVSGLGLLTLGVAPSGEEVARGLCFLLAAIFYGGVWLSIAMLFSVLFRSAATALMSSLGLWLVLTFLWSSIVQFIGQVMAPNDASGGFLNQPNLAQFWIEQSLSWLSPYELFNDSVFGILDPTRTNLGPVFNTYLLMIGGTPGAPLRLGQSLLEVWPELTGLIAATVALFVITYVVFQRQEVRA